MTELHNNALVIEHTKILSKLTEQIESICLKLTRLERFIDDSFPNAIGNLKQPRPRWTDDWMGEPPQCPACSDQNREHG